MGTFVTFSPGERPTRRKTKTMKPTDYRNLRVQMDLTQAQLAALLDVSRKTITARETEDRPGRVIGMEAALAMQHLAANLLETDAPTSADQTQEKLYETLHHWASEMVECEEAWGEWDPENGDQAEAPPSWYPALAKAVEHLDVHAWLHPKKIHQHPKTFATGDRVTLSNPQSDPNQGTILEIGHQYGPGPDNDQALVQWDPRHIPGDPKASHPLKRRDTNESTSNWHYLDNLRRAKPPLPSPAQRQAAAPRDKSRPEAAAPEMLDDQAKTTDCQV